MSTIKTILDRMMTDPAFADAVFTNAEKALVEYDLSTDEVAEFREISRTDFDTFVSATPEERKSLAGFVQSFNVFNRLVA